MNQYFDRITEPLLMQSYATLFFVSFILCIIIILSSGYGFSRRGEGDETLSKVPTAALFRGLVALRSTLQYLF